MERKKNILLFIILIINVSVHASNKYDIYKAYIGNSMNTWKIVIDSMIENKNLTKDEVLELINYCYGYIGWLIHNDNKSDAEKYIIISEKYLSLLEKERYKLSWVYAYKSALIGFKIGLNILRAPFIGPKSIQYAKQSLDIDSLNYLAYIQLGNAEYYMPKIFGGSKDKALKYYLKAQEIMESKPENLENDWNYLNLLVYIGKIYLELGNYTKSKFYFDKILKIEPNFHWVKHELYPKLFNKFN